MSRILGIGSRIDHPTYGKGVVTNVTAKMYWVTFIENGLETIDVDDEFEVIDAAEDEVSRNRDGDGRGPRSERGRVGSRCPLDRHARSDLKRLCRRTRCGGAVTARG